MSEHEEVEVVHVRLPKELVRIVDHYAIEAEVYRQDAVARLLREGLTAMGFRWPPDATQHPVAPDAGAWGRGGRG